MSPKTLVTTFFAAIMIAAALTSTPANASGYNNTLHMQLVATDTNERYPFAEIRVNGASYHVTEGDQLFGVTVWSIKPTTVLLSNRETLRVQPQAAFHQLDHIANVHFRLDQTPAWRRFIESRAIPQ